MNRVRYVALYNILVGLMMTGMWIMLISTGQVPYLDTPQVEIKLHIITEVATAFSLILGGVSIIKEWAVRHTLPYVSHGMLLYTIMNSSGYYIDLGDTAMVAMFSVLLVCTIVSLIVYSRENPLV